MLPDIICIGIILFFVCAMAVSSYDSTKLRAADRLGLWFGVVRRHNESCFDLRKRIDEKRLQCTRGYSGFETAMKKAAVSCIAFRDAFEQFHEGTK